MPRPAPGTARRKLHPRAGDARGARHRALRGRLDLRPPARRPIRPGGAPPPRAVPPCRWPDRPDRPLPPRHAHEQRAHDREPAPGLPALPRRAGRRLGWRPRDAQGLDGRRVPRRRPLGDPLRPRRGQGPDLRRRLQPRRRARVPVRRTARSRGRRPDRARRGRRDGAPARRRRRGDRRRWSASALRRTTTSARRGDGRSGSPVAGGRVRLRRRGAGRHPLLGRELRRSRRARQYPRRRVRRAHARDAPRRLRPLVAARGARSATGRAGHATATRDRVREHEPRGGLGGAGE